MHPRAKPTGQSKLAILKNNRQYLTNQSNLGPLSVLRKWVAYINKRVAMT